jgi:hypothetical protein
MRPAGDLTAWNAGLDRDPARWTFRTHIAADIMDAALRSSMRGQ